MASEDCERNRVLKFGFELAMEIFEIMFNNLD
jgi:hypothetical protein